MADKIPYKHRTIQMDAAGAVCDSKTHCAVLCPWCDRVCNTGCAAYRAVKGKDNALCIAGPKGVIIGKIDRDVMVDPDDDYDEVIENEEEDESE